MSNKKETSYAYPTVELQIRSDERDMASKMTIGNRDNLPRTNTIVIGRSCLDQVNLHSNCVIIGHGLETDHDYQVKIGNSVVQASRTLTPEEFKTVGEIIAWVYNLSGPQAELAALREELAETADDLDTATHHNIDLQIKNAEAMKLLHMAKELLSTISLHRTMAPSDWCESFKAEVADRLEKLRAVTQPTESGASE